MKSITGKDGSCLFRSSVVIQYPDLLNNKDIQTSKASELRNQIAEQMRKSPGDYFAFVEIERLKVLIKLF